MNTGQGKIDKMWRAGQHLSSVVICCVLLLINYSFVFGQTPNRDELVGKWIGIHTEWDAGFTCALPIYIQLDTDGKYHIGMIDGSAQTLSATWDKQGDSIRLDTVRYAPDLISLTQNILRVGKSFPMVFRRFNDIPLDSAQIHKALSGRVWQSDSLTLSFFPDGKVAMENPHTKQRTAHFWQLNKIDKSFFLVIRGNQYNQRGDYKWLKQLRSVSPTSLQLIGSNGKAVVIENFRFNRPLSAADTCRPNGFQTCSNCYRRAWYETNRLRGSERYNLVQLVRKQYEPVYQQGESGLVRIQFEVNCEGEKGKFFLTGFDEDYCPRSFDKRISGQLLTICRDYIANDSSLRQPNDSPHDVAVSLTFRLKNGQITDILP